MLSTGGFLPFPLTGKEGTNIEKTTIEETVIKSADTEKTAERVKFVGRFFVWNHRKPSGLGRAVQPAPAGDDFSKEVWKVESCATERILRKRYRPAWNQNGCIF